MGRIRTVKPELFQHCGLFDAEAESGLPLRLAFIGLFTCCDREGRFKWRPRELKLAVLPHDDIDFSRVLDALASHGFIRRYTMGAESYGVIPTWNRHQVINNKERASQLPSPEESEEDIGLPTRGPREDDASPTSAERKGGEGNMEKEGNMEREGDIERESKPSFRTHSADGRHAKFRELFTQFWNFLNPGIEMPWDGGEAKQLASLLSANPGLTDDMLRLCLENRAHSVVNRSERPRSWIARVTDFASGPLDKFGKPLQGVNRNGKNCERYNPSANRESTNWAAIDAACISLSACEGTAEERSCGVLDRGPHGSPGNDAPETSPETRGRIRSGPVGGSVTGVLVGT